MDIRATSSTTFDLFVNLESIAWATIVDFGADVQLCKLYTLPRERGKGYATLLLQKILRYYGKKGKKVYLYAEQYDEDGLDAETLRRWYKRLGFTAAPGRMLVKKP